MAKVIEHDVGLLSDAHEFIRCNAHSGVLSVLSYCCYIKKLTTHDNCILLVIDVTDEGRLMCMLDGSMHEFAYDDLELGWIARVTLHEL